MRHVRALGFLFTHGKNIVFFRSEPYFCKTIKSCFLIKPQTHEKIIPLVEQITPLLLK